MSTPPAASRAEAQPALSQQVIMFADIVGSTSLYEKIGDEPARELTARCMARMGEVVHARHGRVTAELGDEIMCFFQDPAEAAAAACELHARIAETFPGDATTPPLKLRIGMHYGSVVGEKDDLMSETAKIAHWAARNAKSEQTLATVPVIDALPRIYRAVSRYVDDETWNFVSFEHVALYEIIWDVEAITAASVEKTKPEDRRCELVSFSVGGDSVVVNAERPVISIGRGTQNDLTVKNDLVSRQHFTAQFSRGRCTITDKSTNGTFVLPAGGGRHEVRRDTFPLSGSGVIVLGSPLQHGDVVAIQYVCK